MDNFITSIQEAVALFRTLEDTKPLHIISNKDTDGITAAAIILAALRKEKKPTITTLVKQVTENFLETLEQEHYETYFFLDMGAGYLDMISKKLKNKNIFVLDHHYPDSFATTDNTFIHINPHLHNIDGTKAISAAGIAYLFAKTLDEKNKKLAHLAIIGSIGDMQEHQGFVGINKDILQDALDEKKIKVKQGLRLFGIHTKPLHKFLEYTTNPYLPMVTGSEQGSLKFLKKIGINPKTGNVYKWAEDLPREDLQKLYAAIMMKDATVQTQATNPIGPIYLLPQEDKTSPTHDATEYSTLINACGKLGQPSLGLGICLGDAKIKEKANLLLHRYHSEIFSCLNWFYKHRGTEQVKETERYVIINAEQAIRDGLIGTLVSMISKSNIYPEGTVLIGLATMLSDEIKVSTRICGYKDSSIDLRKIVKMAIKQTGGQGGGHRLAAGATIPAGKVPQFVKACVEQLDKFLIEEQV